MGHEKFDAMGIIFEEPTCSDTKSFDKKSARCGKQFPDMGNKFPHISQCMGIFFPCSWKIDENTHIFLTHGFWEVFPVFGQNIIANTNCCKTKYKSVIIINFCEKTSKIYIIIILST